MESIDFEILTSKTNPKVKEAASLLTPQGRKKTGMFIIEGLRLCEDAARRGIECEMFFCTRRIADRYREIFLALACRAAQVYIINDAIVEKLTDTERSQGVFMVCKRPGSDKEPVINPDGFYLMTENIQNPDNLGAIVRSCEALGANGLIVTGGCDIYTPKALRASMGAMFRFPVIKRESPVETVKELKAMGMKIFVTVVAGKSENIVTAPKTGGCICVMGNEGNGVSKEVRELSDSLITIPMKGNGESLNASAATAITVWEFMKDR